MLECLQISKVCNDKYVISYNDNTKFDLLVLIEQRIKMDSHIVFYDIKWGDKDIDDIIRMWELYRKIYANRDTCILNECEFITFAVAIRLYNKMIHHIENDKLLHQIDILINEIYGMAVAK